MKTLIPITMMGKPRMTRQDKWLDPPRPAVAKYRILKAYLEEFAAKNRFILPDSFIVDIFLPMADSWSKKRKDKMDNKPHQLKPDIDNLLKALLDCIKYDDQTVHTITIRKFWSYEPRLEITTE